MKAIDFADSLKIFVNWDKSELVKDTLEYPFDFFRAIENGLIEIGKHSRVFEKIVWFPVQKDKVHYLTNISKLTKDLISFVKILNIKLLATDGTVQECIDSKYIEQIDNYERYTFNEIAEQLYGNRHFLKTRNLEDGVAECVFTKINSVGTANQITLPVSVDAGDTITNLSFSDEGKHFSAQIGVGGTSPVLDWDVTSGEFKWSADDKVCITEKPPTFISLLLQSMPSKNSIETGEEDIFVPAQVENSLRDLAVSYLYSVLVPRNPQFAQSYQALLSVGTLLSYPQALLEVRKKTQMKKPLIVRSYDPY